jgi:hypothetical protein
VRHVDISPETGAEERPSDPVLRRFYEENRQIPTRMYGDTPNPFWRGDVQTRLRATARRRLWEAIALAHLIDLWFVRQGRRQFFYGCRGLSESLGIPRSSAARTVRDLARDFPDVLGVVQGVPHAVLRIADAFNVRGLETCNVVEPAGESDSALAVPGNDEPAPAAAFEEARPPALEEF